jgi:hypothetical protein
MGFDFPVGLGDVCRRTVRLADLTQRFGFADVRSLAQ